MLTAILEDIFFFFFNLRYGDYEIRQIWYVISLIFYMRLSGAVVSTYNYESAGPSSTLDVGRLRTAVNPLKRIGRYLGT